jgi:hypothetical protein
MVGVSGDWWSIGVMFLDAAVGVRRTPLGDSCGERTLESLTLTLEP